VVLVKVGDAPPFEAEAGSTLLEALRGRGIPVPAGCGGLGLCGMCRVRVLRGDVSPPTAGEVALLGNLLNGGWRLACQVVLRGDVEVEVPLRRGLAKGRVRRSVRITNPVALIPVEVGVGEPSAEEALLRSLSERGVRASALTLRALSSLASAATREGATKVAVVADGEVLDLADDYTALGLAVDVGTTSVAVSLVDLASGAVLDERATLNSQVRYGADVISRVHYAVTHERGVEELQRAAVGTVNELLAEMRAPRDRVYRVVVAGNSVMLHLFFGISPRALGYYPFRPVYRRGLAARASELGLGVHPYALVSSLPILGGYVGGDVVGDLIAADLSEYRVAMLIDVGTNGEVVVKRGDRYVATSAPAGPAFEGVGLRSGMMAVEGAIERVRLTEGGRVEYEVIGGGRPKGICGTGYIDLLAELLRAGLLSESGRLLRGPGVTEVDGVAAFVVAEEEGVLLTQLDVRKLQLAVAAIKLAAKHAMRAAGVEPGDLEAVVVAGDFGYHLDAGNAVRIGLLPPVDESAIRFIGNGSLTGAELYMVSEEARREAESLARVCEVLDVPRDERAFVGELRFGW